MKALDSDTQTMIRQLAAMGEGDRKVVLDGLGTQACEKLVPFLAPTADTVGFSPTLQALVDAAGRGERPAGLTTKGAAALRAAAQTTAPHIMALPRKASVAERIFDLLKRGD